jgi:hypothetical protein
VIATHETLPGAHGGPPIDLKFPAVLRRLDGGLVLLDKDLTFEKAASASPRGGFLFVGPSLAVTERRQLSAGLRSGADLFYVYDFEPFASGQLAFGDLKAGPAPSGFVWTDNAGVSHLLHGVELLSTARILATLGTLSLIASVDGTGYFLAPQEGKARLFAVEPNAGKSELASLPADLASMPAFSYRQEWLTARWGPRQATAHLRQVEISRMPMGLYGWDHELYLLAKEPMDSRGETTWWLARLDRSDGSLKSRIRLPTTAAHLTVIPGDSWVVLEKAPVIALDRMSLWKYSPFMETTSILRFPARLLENQ